MFFYTFTSELHLIDYTDELLEGLTISSLSALQIKCKEKGCHHLHFIYCIISSCLEKFHHDPLYPCRRSIAYSSLANLSITCAPQDVSITSAIYFLDSSLTYLLFPHSLLLSAASFTQLKSVQNCFPCAVLEVGRRYLQTSTKPPDSCFSGFSLQHKLEDRPLA